MKLLLFGGSFNPPHLGHINNLRAAMGVVQPDKVIVMPAGTPPHKAACSTSGDIRLELCGCFKELSPLVEVSDWEIRREGRSYSVETLLMLRETYPEAELFMTIGSDMLETFREWRRWQEILRLTTLVVESRNPGDSEELRRAAEPLEAEGGRIIFCHAEPIPAASSDIRAGRAGKELLPPSVAELVERYGLYRND